MSCFRSLSPPSEPPCIGKWFSSYEYESPEVNFGEAGVNFISGDVQLRKLGNSDNEMNETLGEDGAQLGRYRKRKMVPTCDKISSSEPDDDRQSRMNVDSLSLPSEPPDIRNWFSSYVYESPELDTGAGLDISVFKNIQLDQQDLSNKQKIQAGKSNGEYRSTLGNEHVVNEKDGIADLNEGRSPLESDKANDMCFTDSVSLPSEPPDIRNWFPSYVYESPALFTDGELGVPFVQDIQSGDCDENIFKRNGRKSNGDINNSSLTKNKASMHENFVLTDLTPSLSNVKYDSYQDSLHTSCWTFIQVNSNCRVGESGKNIDCFPNLSDQIVEETQTQCTNHSTTGIGMEKIFDKTDSPPSRNKIVQDANESRCSRRLIHRKNSTVKHSNFKACSSKEVSPANPVSSVTKAVPPTKDTGKNSNYIQGIIVLEQVDDSMNVTDKENEHPEVAGNGFISTKKHRRKIPNRYNPYFLQKTATDQDHDSITKKVQGSSTMAACSKRVAMSDVTNMQHSTEEEISGKWKCPQRSKSNLQPSLKQLRLEQWVTRA